MKKHQKTSRMNRRRKSNTFLIVRMIKTITSVKT